MAARILEEYLQRLPDQMGDVCKGLCNHDRLSQPVFCRSVDLGLAGVNLSGEGPARLEQEGFR